MLLSPMQIPAIIARTLLSSTPCSSNALIRAALKSAKYLPILPHAVQRPAAYERTRYRRDKRGGCRDDRKGVTQPRHAYEASGNGSGGCVRHGHRNPMRAV